MRHFTGAVVCRARWSSPHHVRLPHKQATPCSKSCSRTDPRYEIVGPKVDHLGDMAVLSLNLVSYGRLGGQPESVLARWNSTEVYRRTGGQWRMVHSHWSRTQADIKPGA